MTKEDYYSPYDFRDTDCIMDDLFEDGIIDLVSSEDHDELETIILDAIKEFNDSILNDESIDDDEDMDYQDLRSDQYYHIKECVLKKYSKAFND